MMIIKNWSTGAAKIIEKCRCKQMHSYLECLQWWEISYTIVREISGKIGINFQKPPEISGLTTLLLTSIATSTIYLILT